MRKLSSTGIKVAKLRKKLNSHNLRIQGRFMELHLRCNFNLIAISKQDKLHLDRIPWKINSIPLLI